MTGIIGISAVCFIHLNMIIPFVFLLLNIIIIFVLGQFILSNRFRLSITRLRIQFQKTEQVLRNLSVKHDQELKTLSLQQQNKVESDRARIAREIHDDLGQTLTILNLNLDRMLKLLPANALELQKTARVMSPLIEGSIQSMRTIAKDLRPLLLDDFGLAAALQSLVTEFETSSGITCSFRTRQDVSSPDGNLAMAIYRICQEGLNNIIKHASPTKARITLILDKDTIVLKITDNGIGIAKDQSKKRERFGLIGIQERVDPYGGRLTLRGLAGIGFSIRIRLPL